MTISYNWLSEYLPVRLEPERLSNILTSIGLEVESMEKFESLKGGLAGLVIGEVMSSEPHPNADKLKLTTVNTGNDQVLQIVCGAPNVMAGQKVVVAPVGSTIYPKNAAPVTMKVARIRGVESHGMICAADEIGLSDDHSGILVLPEDLQPGIPAAEYFEPFVDWIYEIGLTPNRTDAMSHMGVARDVCAYLTHHDKKDLRPKQPTVGNINSSSDLKPIRVEIQNKEACKRYSGISISGILVGPSPKWLTDRLISIGQRPINNIVDITNFVMHETGQPLHAFDLDAVTDNSIIVRNLPEGTSFITLDEKERKLSKNDLMICNGKNEPMCIAGVFGGSTSGVKDSTRGIFLESAWFNPVDIRKTSFRHNLRTEAASRFEKNLDISNTVEVLKRAASLIKEIAGANTLSEIVDVYPVPPVKNSVTLTYQYLKKLSGKTYDPQTVKSILSVLGFEIANEDSNKITVLVPHSKTDISLPADIVEEVMRIDGYDNIEIPTSIQISPSVENDGYRFTFQEKTANQLAGIGFSEIFTNSITNAAYFDDADLKGSVRLLNNLSAVHNIMRPSMLETGLEAVAYNLNRKNPDLKFFEFGKTYQATAETTYTETNHLCLYVTGDVTSGSWKARPVAADFFYLKGVVSRVLQLAGIVNPEWKIKNLAKLSTGITCSVGQKLLVAAGTVSGKEGARFDIRQPVFYADIHWDALLSVYADRKLRFTELPKQLPVYRDLALVVRKDLRFEELEAVVKRAKLEKLQQFQLFDIFESNKLGEDKKSLAVSFTFLDEEKTLTDKEIDQMMNKLMAILEAELQAGIRK